MQNRTMQAVVTVILKNATAKLEARKPEALREEVIFESDIATSDLQSLLSSYEKGEEKLSKEPATYANFTKIILNISNRWDVIWNNDCSYFVSPNSSANVFYKAVAEEIALALGEGFNYLDVLCPNLKGFNPRSQFKRYILREEVITGPGGETKNALPLIDAFRMLESQFEDQDKNDDFPSEAKTLTVKEVQILATHSPASQAYHDAIIARTKVKEAREAFLRAIEKDDYKIGASHHISRKNSLIRALVEKRKDQKEFIQLLACRPRHRIDAFIDLIPDDLLFNFMINIKDYESFKFNYSKTPIATDTVNEKLAEMLRGGLATEIKNKLIFLDSHKDNVKPEERIFFKEGYVRAMMIAYFMVYMKIRNLEPPIKNPMLAVAVSVAPSVYGWFKSVAPSYVPVAPSANDKQSACQRVIDQLKDNSPFLNYLHGVPFTNDKVLGQGDLLELKKLMVCYFEHVQMVVESRVQESEANQEINRSIWGLKLN